MSLSSILSGYFRISLLLNTRLYKAGHDDKTLKQFVKLYNQMVQNLL